MAGAGANGVALFNRFYQPDINIDSLRLQPSLHPSTSAEALLAMRWIAILYGRIEGCRWAPPAGCTPPRTPSSCCSPGPTWCICAAPCSPRGPPICGTS
jgi:hypothetical protein